MSGDPTMMSARAMTMTEAETSPARWSGVFAMSLCVFALIASEFMPVSLLTPMAAGLYVSEGWAGYGIAISGAFAVITSLSISALVGSMNRKTVLLALTVVMAISGAVVATAPNYPVYMFGRALIERSASPARLGQAQRPEVQAGMQFLEA